MTTNFDSQGRLHGEPAITRGETFISFCHGQLHGPSIVHTPEGVFELNYKHGAVTSRKHFTHDALLLREEHYLVCLDGTPVLHLEDDPAFVQYNKDYPGDKERALISLWYLVGDLQNYKNGPTAIIRDHTGESTHVGFGSAAQSVGYYGDLTVTATINQISGQPIRQTLNVHMTVAEAKDAIWPGEGDRHHLFYKGTKMVHVQLPLIAYGVRGGTIIDISSVLALGSSPWWYWPRPLDVLGQEMFLRTVDSVHTMLEARGHHTKPIRN